MPFRLLREEDRHRSLRIDGKQVDPQVANVGLHLHLKTLPGLEHRLRVNGYRPATGRIDQENPPAETAKQTPAGLFRQLLTHHAAGIDVLVEDLVGTPRQRISRRDGQDKSGDCQRIHRLPST